MIDDGDRMSTGVIPALRRLPLLMEARITLSAVQVLPGFFMKMIGLGVVGEDIAFRRSRSFIAR
jgi:hypothetical protein